MRTRSDKEEEQEDARKEQARGDRPSHQIAYTTGTGSYTAGGCEERSYMIPALFISRREGGSNTKIPSREE